MNLLEELQATVDLLDFAYLNAEYCGSEDALLIWDEWREAVRKLEEAKLEA